MECVAVPEPTAGSSRSVKSLVIGSKRTTSVSFEPRSRKHFEVVGPVTSPRKSYVDDPSLGAALDRETFECNRRSGCDRRAPPIFTFSKKK